MKNNSTHNRGFTLVELSVALGVAVIVLSVLSLSIYYLHNAFKTSENVSNCVNDYDSVKAQIVNVADSWTGAGYTIKIAEDDSVCCVNTSQEVQSKMFFKENILYKDSEQLFQTKEISAISFKLFKDDVVAVVHFTNNQQLHFII